MRYRMADKNYVECGDCTKREGATVIDTCTSVEAITNYRKSNSGDSIYCEDINRNRDCKFIKLNFSGLIDKIFNGL
jgi:hypothetical protein